MSNLPPPITDERLWELWRQADNMDTVEFNVAFGRLVAEEAVRLEREAAMPVIYIDNKGALQSRLSVEQTEFVLGPLVDHMRLHLRARSQEVQG